MAMALSAFSENLKISNTRITVGTMQEMKSFIQAIPE
jgi:hypothetical protein